MKKGYNQVIWIIGGILLLVILAYIVVYAVKSGVLHLEKQNPETSVTMPLLPSLTFFRKRRKASSFLTILFLILVGIMIVSIIIYWIKGYANKSHGLVNPSNGQQTTTYLTCVKSCSASSQDYDTCIKECANYAEKKSNN